MYNPFIMKKEQLVDRVNSFMGVRGAAGCLIGPYRPMGMVRLGPDTSFPQPTSGYRPGGALLGFSHTHVAGTGGCSRYGNVRLMPFSGEARVLNMKPFLQVPNQRVCDTIPQDEKSDVGRYSATVMPWNVKAELTATRHCGIHRYCYLAGRPAGILLDAASFISTGLGMTGEVRPVEWWDSEASSVGGFLESVSDTEFVGRSDFQGGWGHHKPYSIYFYLKTDQPVERFQLACSGGLMAPGSLFVTGSGCRATLDFGSEEQEINTQVGISFVSIANARSCVEQEVGEKSFTEIVTEAKAEWGTLLSRYQVGGGTEEHRRIFYSLLYRLFCMPTDLGVDEENPNWKSGRRQFTDIYCLWDSIRNANSFFHLFEPELSRDMMNALLDVADHTGWLPDAYIANQPAFMQSACAADILFSEAAQKNIEGVDYAKALKYTKKNAQEEPKDVMVAGRYLKDYHEYGYLSTDVPKACVSRHIEYTYHDHCIARLADKLGEAEVAEEFDGYASRIWNLWNPERKMFWPRRPDGRWLKEGEDGFDPHNANPEGWNNSYSYEGSCLIWSLNALHDLPGLIRRMGGGEAFVEHLDRIFDEEIGGVRQFCIKETRMHIPHLYSFAGRPDKAADRVRETIAQHYSNDDIGFLDNEDMGCQSACFLWNSMGLYPLYGTDLYTLVAPFFDRIECMPGGVGEKLVITAEGEGIYVQAATLNGKPLDRAWIRHAEISGGAELHFVRGTVPSEWGFNEQPPSGI